jgi:hypothetical protein
MGRDDGLVPVNFRAPESSKGAYERAAEAVGMSLSAWVRTILDGASGASELPEQLRRVTRDPSEVRDGKW